ncbi:MAG: GspE/PulE family protein [Patescibacteria group bacterium]|nr:GspE/PulE family protein [Patescibacteria group bacterium]
MNSNDLKRAYKFLVANSIIKKKDADAVFKESKKNNADIFDVLISAKIVDEERVVKAKAEFLGVPYINLKEKVILSDVLSEVPEKAALFYKMTPFERVGDTVKIAMVDPNNVDAIDALKFISIKRNIKTKIHLVSRSGFSFAVKQYKTFSEELKNVLENVDRQIIIDKEKQKKGKEGAEKIAEQAPVSKIVDIIISNAVEGKASDIHIESEENELRVRYRLDGVLHNSLTLPKKISMAVISRIKILSNLKIDETRKPQDGRFRFVFSGSGEMERSVDLRVSTFPTVNGEKVVMRILDTSSNIGDLESLGINKGGLKVVQENIKKPFGIMLVTGPTGSGKSTTLYAMLKILNKEGVNIVTLEDPVEYFMAGINQSQIKAEIEYTFASGLRSILRQDPDIIMVGEIRDKETAELATHAALTGHLVLSTLHTNNASGVIPRLIDMGIEPFLIASSLNIAIGQRLVRRICKECIKEVEPSEEIKKIIQEELDKIPDSQKSDLDLKNGIKLFSGAGCKKCKQSGFSGRVGVYEVFKMTSDVEAIISSKVTDTEIAKEAERQGMITMKQDAIMKVLKGLTTIEEALRIAED